MSEKLAVPVSNLDHSAGPPHGAVTLVEYGDFECPACAAVEPMIVELREKHEHNLRFVFRHFPQEQVHPHALMAAEAAEAAGAQGKFWEMHDLLYQHSKHLERAKLDGFARQLGLDVARFISERDDEVYRQRVREHQEGGRQSNVHGTPTFFVNGAMADLRGGLKDLFDLVAARAAGR